MNTNNHLALTSPVFTDGQLIPARYTCSGLNVSPPLDIAGIPEDAVSLALIMHDPDAPTGDFLHWSIWNLHADIVSLGENELPEGAVQGSNDFGKKSYGGPCPPSGTHRYIFELYALDSLLDLPAGTDGETVLDTIHDHELAVTTLTGRFSAAGK